MTTTTKTIINVDEGDENADWIKRVRGGESQKRELAIHDQIAKESADGKMPSGEDETATDKKAKPA